MKSAYPVFIMKDEKSKVHPYLVSIPDFDAVTEGDDFVNAIEMARDLIGLAGTYLEDDGNELPTPSSPKEAKKKAGKDTEIVDFTKGIMTYVDIDFTEYRRKHLKKTVRRNVAILSWLNYEAERAGINVSRVLQDALKSVLGVSSPE